MSISPAISEALGKAAEVAEPGEAIAILEAARAEQGDVVELLLALIDAQTRAGRLKDGVGVCQALLRAHPTLAAGWRRLGALFQAAGALEQAVKALDRAVDLDPKDRASWILRTETLAFLGRLEPARRSLERTRGVCGAADYRPPLRSIIIPVLRNEPGGLHDVAALLGDLAAFDGEVVVVFNDAEAYAALRSHPRIARSVLNSENVGVGRAWAMGLALIEGQIAVILNSDVRFDDLSSLSALEAALTENDRVVIAGVGGDLIDPDTLNPTRTFAARGVADPVRVDSVQGHLFALHVGRFNDAGLAFDTRLAPFFCEEIDIGQQARRAGLELLVVPTEGWRHAIGISHRDYPVRYLGRPVDRSLALLEARIFLREKWRRVSAEPARTDAVASGPSPPDATSPAGPAGQNAPDRAEDHYYAYSRPEIRELVPKGARRVLDIGCAGGALGAELKRERGCEVWGVEYQADVAAIAQGRLDRVLAGDVFQLQEQLPDRYFDAVILADVLEHVIDTDGLMEIVRRKLAPTGRLVLSLPNIGHWSILVELMEGRWEYTGEGLMDRTHLRFFTPSSAQRMLARTGFVPEIASGRQLPNVGPPEGFADAVRAFGLAVDALPSIASVYQMFFVCRVK